MSGLGDMGNLLKQAQKMQQELDRVQSELAAARVQGVAGGGAVRVAVDGEGQVVEVRISQEVLATGDKDMLEDLLLAALRDGIGRAAELRKEQMSKVTGGLHLPGLF
jgi:nucleoid-associated protein EbfC